MTVGKMYGNWRAIVPIGGGGQGDVFVAWKYPPQPSELVLHNLMLAQFGTDNERVIARPKVVPSGAYAVHEQLFHLLMALDDWQANYLGAIKTLKGNFVNDQAVQRMRREVSTLKNLSHPNILKILDENLDGHSNTHWMVTQFLKRGSVDKHAGHYKGNALRTLKAIRPIVDALAYMHNEGVIHRDVKPHNILVGDNGELILGDMGLVYLVDKESQRLSNTMESAGTSDWMAGWARGGRLKPESAKGNLDNFGVGKVIYCLIAGREKLINWYHRDDHFNLTKLFEADKEMMERVNDFLDGCIVEKEKNCRWRDAKELLPALDQLIADIENGYGSPRDRVKRRCLVCGTGAYVTIQQPKTDQPSKSMHLLDELLGRSAGSSDTIVINNHPYITDNRLFACNRCGNVQLFISFPSSEEFSQIEKK